MRIRRAHTLELTSNVLVTCRDRLGRVVQTVEVHNKIVDRGLELARDLLARTGFPPNEIAVGTGTTAPVAGDTALEAEVIRKPISRRIQQAFGVDFEILLAFGEANSNTLAEVGLFDSGNLFARAILSPTIAKNSGIEVTVSHNVTVSEAP